MQIFENGKKSTLVKIPFNPVSFKLMPNDPWKAIISGSKQTEAWDLQNKCKMFDICGPVTSMDFQPLDSEMVALAQGSKWSLFDLSEGAEICSVDTGEPITEIQFHPDGLIMSTGHSNGDLKLWDIRT